VSVFSGKLAGAGGGVRVWVAFFGGKRNWRVNGWLLALAIISSAAAVWALFIR
jgi:hypothetical protein